MVGEVSIHWFARMTEGVSMRLSANWRVRPTVPGWGAELDDEETSWMDAWVYGAGTVTFYWRMSVGDDVDDELRFYIDGVLQDTIDGDVSWTQKSYNISGDGLHVLVWEYERDCSTDDYGSAWVDYLTWTGDTEPPASDDWKIAEYVYDPAGRRIEKKFDGITEVKYFYDGDQCIAEYDADDNLLRKFIYGPGIDQPICMIKPVPDPIGDLDSNAVSYYHYDGLGSVVALSDEDGDTIQVYEYDVYGNVAASDPNHTNPFMFTGRRFDTETGLYFYRARYYNPALGRFLQTDPIGYDDGMNWYAYCSNNPIGSADPSGCRANTITLPIGWSLEWRRAYDNVPVLHLIKRNLDGTVADGLEFEDVAEFSDWRKTHPDFCETNPAKEMYEATIGQVPLTPIYAMGVLVEALLDGASDGVAMAVCHDKGTIDKWGGNIGDVGWLSSVSGWVGEGTLTLAGAISLWAYAGGATMSVAAGDVANLGAGEGFHVAYGANGGWLHAVGGSSGMQVTSRLAAEFAGTCSWWTTVTGIPIFDVSGLTATEGTAATSCVGAAWTAYVQSGGAAQMSHALIHNGLGIMALDQWLSENGG